MTMEMKTEMKNVKADIQIELQGVRVMKKDTVVMKGVSTKGSEEMKELNKCLKTEVESGFRNEGCERSKVYDTLAKMKDDMNSTKLGSCGVSIAARTRLGLGSGALPRPSHLGQNWRRAWVPKKIDVKGWVNG